MSTEHPAAKRAKEYLVHYLKQTHPEGFFGHDAISEMESIVDDILEAALDQSKACIKGVPKPLKSFDMTATQRSAAPTQQTTPDAQHLPHFTDHRGDCSIYCCDICDCGYLRDAVSHPLFPEPERPWVAWAKHQKAIDETPSNCVHQMAEPTAHLQANSTQCPRCGGTVEFRANEWPPRCPSCDKAPPSGVSLSDPPRFYSTLNELAEENKILREQRDAARHALRLAKFKALTAKSESGGLAHIIRVCLDAGVVEQLPELERLFRIEVHPEGGK